jgi:hypothetical protein
MGVRKNDRRLWIVGQPIPLEIILKNDAGQLITTAGALAYLIRYKSDMTLDTYDFSDDTFKTSAVTAETAALSYKKSNNTLTDTGMHTGQITTLTSFQVGDCGLVRYYHPNASPTFVEEEWQYVSSSPLPSGSEEHIWRNTEGTFFHRGG